MLGGHAYLRVAVDDQNHLLGEHKVCIDIVNLTSGRLAATNNANSRAPYQVILIIHARPAHLDSPGPAAAAGLGKGIAAQNHIALTPRDAPHNGCRETPACTVGNRDRGKE